MPPAKTSTAAPLVLIFGDDDFDEEFAEFDDFDAELDDVAVRTAVILLRAPLARRRVLRLRAGLIRELEAMREVYRRTLQPGVLPGAGAE